MEQGPYGTGSIRRQSMYEKDCARTEMEKEKSKHDRARERRQKQRDTASEESKANKSQTD